jgi:carboxyl-terminal processing protease
LKLTTAKYYIPSGRCIQALDYTHRNEDGSVGRIPDSLVTEFKTKGGRSVYDGGGVNPDVIIEPQTLSKISISLYTKNLIFDYATKFRYTNDSIPTAEKFTVTEAVYDDFTAFLADKEFDYTLESEKMLNELEIAIEKDKYTDRISTEIDELRKKLTHDKNMDLKLFQSEIEDLLREEIISRYYFQTGRAKAMIDKDPLVDSAIHVLQNSEHYSSILKIN